MMKICRRVATRRGVLGPLVVGASAVALIAARSTATTAAPNVATTVPQVIGPIASTAAPGDPSHDYIFYSTPMDLAKVGYEEQEYFIRGVATRYNTANPNASSPIGEMPYETRIVVRRPTNPQRFGGVVVVDWQNVTAGHDIDTEWGGSGDFFVRHGWVWVGASVQRVGVNGATTGATANLGLKQWSPSRYGPLDLTNGGAVLDDSQSYDVYTQIARLVKQGPSSGPNPFAGLAVRDVYAGGVSQSATFLMRYYNALQSAAGVYDGFLVGLGGGVPRADVGTKLMKVYTETDVLLSQAAIRVTDSATIHTWEVTGGSHVPASAVSPDPTDFRATLGRIQTREYGPAPPVDCTNPGPSDVEVWAVFHAAYAALDRWVSEGVPPATANPIQVASLGPPVTLVRDADGIALGGIRLPKVTVPVALNNGVNSAASVTNPLSLFCILYGTHVPFDAAKLAALYPTHGSYVSRVTKAVHNLVGQQFLLQEDAQALRTDAAQSGFGK
jgi:alpha/beta hydrolase family protein